MNYPDHNTYAKVYARYLTGDRTAQLITAAGLLQGKDIADLCAGGGRLSRMALEQGARVTAVDESPDMAAGLPDEVIRHVRGIEDWLQAFCGNNEFDVVFCQQAVNYWLTPELARDLSEVIRPGGAFIFNTFNRKPSPVPVIKQYELDGVHFVEVSWLSGTRTIEHVQIREGMPPHTTQFFWISSQEYREWLSPYFDLDEQVNGATTVWVCTVKDTESARQPEKQK